MTVHCWTYMIANLYPFSASSSGLVRLEREAGRILCKEINDQLQSIVESNTDKMWDVFKNLCNKKSKS